MRSLPRLSALGVFLLLWLTGPAAAQIMRITTDNPTDNTVLNASGTTLLTITLDPSVSLNGDAFCNWAICPGGPAAGCYVWAGEGPTCDSGQPLQVYGYNIALWAVGGTVTWGTFTPTPEGAYGGTQTEISGDGGMYLELRFFGLHPGVFASGTLGTIPVTISSPYTHIEIARPTQVNFDESVETSLYLLNCTGAFGRGYILGNRFDPCRYAADWFDAYGAISPMDACLAKANHGQCQVCCKTVGGSANTCAKFCNQIKGGAGEPLP